MSVNISYYNENAVEIAKQYDSLDFESVHRSWRDYWPKSGESVLDVGAGSGRDARWFFQQGCPVVAIEPAKELRQLGVANSSPQIQWLAESLPALEQVHQLSRKYDLILISAVWMHLTKWLRVASMQTLARLLSDNGNLVITLRHGDFNDGRETFGVSVAEIEQLSSVVGLSICHVADGLDALNRTGVTWQTVVLERTDNLNGGEIAGGT